MRDVTRRRFLGAAATAAAFASFSYVAEGSESYRNEISGYGPLIPDPEGVLDLPQGFSYRILSRSGQRMTDGFRVPGRFDGMAVFPLDAERVALVRNHELKPQHRDSSAFQEGSWPEGIGRDQVYDIAEDGLPLPGGTTNLVYNLRTRQLESEHLTLTGTAINCAGGPTPWNSWLTCEETVLRAGEGGVQRDHGWVFEVPAQAKGLVAPVPLTGLGRFRHEAAAIDPRTGIVYLTEDQDDGLLYRFLPNDRRRLDQGGRLQALGFRDPALGGDSRNWHRKVLEVGGWVDAVWIDLDHTDNPDNDLAQRGQQAGAACFARGEGIHFGVDEFYMCCTSGGPARLGQIMRYVPSPEEGQPGEIRQPGRLQLFVESDEAQLFNSGDNLTVAPWGDLIVCEDKYSRVHINHLKGVTREGRIYTLARSYGGSELAGACFSPDGATLFVNVYIPGITLAIDGPWTSLDMQRMPG